MKADLAGYEQPNRLILNQTFGLTHQVHLESLHKGCTDLAGFEPAICSLGDCRPIQARLQAQRRNTCERGILG